jgi:hypothetical protein
MIYVYLTIQIVVQHPITGLAPLGLLSVIFASIIITALLERFK